MCALFTIENSELSLELQNKATSALEDGEILYYKDNIFPIECEKLLYENQEMLDSSHKNISYDYKKDTLAKFTEKKLSESEYKQLKILMRAFAEYAKNLIINTCPQYQDKLIWGRTSYRPIEIEGRKTSKRKDDTRLHVDAFPSSPVAGKRILRVFYNINPNNKPRVWHTGEEFNRVLTKFIPTVKAYNPFIAKLLNFFKITKTLRTKYDHFMLKIHDNMKLDDKYQSTVKKNIIAFPAFSSWIVFTDCTSHAALSGQFLLEQTFYLEPKDMQTPDKAPAAKLLKNELTKLHGEK